MDSLRRRGNKVRIRSAVLLNVILATLSTAVHAGPVQRAFVLAEDDDQDNRTCNALMSSSADAVKAALRYSGTTIVQRSGKDVVTVWITTSAMETSTRNCAVNHNLQMYTAQTLAFPGERSIFGPAEYCQRGGLMNWPKTTLQDRLNEIYRRHVEACLSEIEQKLAS